MVQRGFCNVNTRWRYVLTSTVPVGRSNNKRPQSIFLEILIEINNIFLKYFSINSFLDFFPPIGFSVLQKFLSVAGPERSWPRALHKRANFSESRWLKASVIILWLVTGSRISSVSFYTAAGLIHQAAGLNFYCGR